MKPRLQNNKYGLVDNFEQRQSTVYTNDYRLRFCLILECTFEVTCASLIHAKKLCRDGERPQESVSADEAERRRTTDLNSANLDGGGIGFQLSTFAQRPDITSRGREERGGGGGDG